MDYNHRDTLLSGYEMYLAEPTVSILKPARCGEMTSAACRSPYRYR
jgi:hypothetical protein